MDPIHGFIDISEYPVISQLVETPYFQRLRRLSQLGLTSNVYPNATHTRFAHCIGVMHVFLILFDSITRRSKLQKLRIERLRPIGAVCALLHDLGHGPFSHASEDILEKGKFNHEIMTRKIILKTEITQILKKNKIDPELVCNILNHDISGDLKILSQLISSQLDADRLDYLVRDSHFTGVNYGKIDIHRIANTLNIWNGKGSFKWTVVVSRKGLSAIEDYLLGRRLMYRGVYFHKVSRCMEKILINIFKRAAEKNDRFLKQIIDIKKEITPEMMLTLDDAVCYTLFHKWTKSEDPVLCDLSKRILNRQIFASYQMNSSEYLKKGVDTLSHLKELFKSDVFPESYYLIQDNPDKSAYGIYSTDEIDDDFSSIGHIMIKDGKNQLKEISSISTLIRTLGRDYDATVTLFFPSKLLPRVKNLLDS